MKLRIVLATAVILASAACGKSANTDSAKTETPVAAEAAPANAAPAAPGDAAAAAGGALTEAYVLGKWADVGDGDCKLAQEFLPGGKVDGLFDSWKLDGNVLVIGMMGETQNMNVKIIDPKHMETQIGTGKPHTLVRC